MPLPIHRTIDASIFLKAYFAEDFAEACKLHLDTVSPNTLICDIVIGEVVRNLHEELREDEDAFQTAVREFRRHLNRFQTTHFDDAAYAILDNGVIDGLDIQPKDKMLVAFAIAQNIPVIETADCGIWCARAEIRKVTPELTMGTAVSIRDPTGYCNTYDCGSRRHRRNR